MYSLKIHNQITYLALVLLTLFDNFNCLNYEEGDTCVSVDIVGVCSLVSKCKTHAVFIQQNLLTAKDIKSCGLAVYEEIICCPIDNEANRNRLIANKFRADFASDDEYYSSKNEYDSQAIDKTRDHQKTDQKLCNPHHKDCIVFRDNENPKFKIGDLCRFKSFVGACTLKSNCLSLDFLLHSKQFVSNDVLSCGLDVYEEVICCPNYEQFLK